MAEQKQDLLTRLADLSEGAVQRLSEAPGADRALQALKGLGDKVDELQRRTRGFEELEERLAAGSRRGGRRSRSGSMAWRRRSRLASPSPSRHQLPARTRRKRAPRRSSPDRS